jgi:hypothetical protein
MPTAIVDVKELGLFGLMIPEYGGLGSRATCWWSRRLAAG